MSRGMSCGWSRTDVITALAGCVVLGCVGVSLVLADPTGRGERLSESLANLRAIGAAVGQYRADNNGYLPLEMTTSRRRPPANNRGVAGWCDFQFGGKNCNPYWFTAFNGVFDVEAADRPLNPYLYPDYTFLAPTPPERLPANDPSRWTAQARVFRDPADVNGMQRLWPNRNNPPISSYDDIGTSYLSNMQWWDQTQGSFFQKFAEGTRRLAVDQGVNPARFVHFSDEFAGIVMYNISPNSQLATNHGTFNQSVTLFADGHAGLITFRPGRNRAAFINETYSVWFEDLGRPSSDRRIIDEPFAR